MNRSFDRQIYNLWIDGYQIYTQIDRWIMIYRQIDGYIDRQMDLQMDRWINGYIDRQMDG